MLPIDTLSTLLMYLGKMIIVGLSFRLAIVAAFFVELSTLVEALVPAALV